MATTQSDIAAPGDRLGTSHEFAAGVGTYERAGHVYASVVGVKSTTPAATPGERPTLAVHRSGATSSEPHIPVVGSTVTARVISINARAASVQVVCVEGLAVAHPFPGVIRKENVLTTDIDRISMEQCVRPGDIVLAEVRGVWGFGPFLLSCVLLTCFSL